MAKLTLTDITSGYASTTALNANNAAIEAALENTLSLDGTTPNSMSADLDMNGNDITNVGDVFIGGVGLSAQVTAASASAAAALASETAAGLSEVAAASSEAAAAISAGDSAASAAIVADWEYKGAWVTSTAYLVNNIVYESDNGASYVCLVDHTSGTFSTDLGSGKWGLLATRGAAGAGTGDMLKSENLSGLANYATARSNLSVSASTDTLLKAGNLSGLASAATARTNLGLGTAAIVNTGTGSGTVPLVGTKSATETLAGLVELATTAEMTAGTADVVPDAAKTKAFVDSAIAALPPSVNSFEQIGSTVVPTAVTAIDFTLDTTTYQRFILLFEDIKCNTVSQELAAYIGDGTTWDNLPEKYVDIFYGYFDTQAPVLFSMGANGRCSGYVDVSIFNNTADTETGALVDIGTVNLGPFQAGTNIKRFIGYSGSSAILYGKLRLRWASTSTYTAGAGTLKLYGFRR